MRVSVSLVLGVGLGCSSPALWAETESPAELEVLTVTAEAERAEGPVQGYRANRTASATRTDTRIEDIPQAISVVPRQVLDDLDSARPGASWSPGSPCRRDRRARTGWRPESNW